MQKMLSDLDRRPMLGNNENSFGDEFEKEIGLLLREQRLEDCDVDERELNIYRSGSAPPTIEGSLNAVGGLFNHGASGGSAYKDFTRNKGGNGFMSEEDFRSDPAYLSYYYSNVNLNPRLPPPSLSKEDWRFAQRLQGGSSAIGDRRKVNRTDSDVGGGGRSLFSMPPGFNPESQEILNESDEVQGSVNWDGDGLIGLPGLGLGSKQKRVDENFQDDLRRSASASGWPSRPASRNALDIITDNLGSLDAEASNLHRDLTSDDPVRTTINNIQGSSAGQHAAAQPSVYSYAAVLGASLSRSTTPDPQRIARAPSPGLAPIGEGRGGGNSEKKNVNSPNALNGVSSHANVTTGIVTALSNMSLSNGIVHNENHLTSTLAQDVDDQNSYLFGLPGNQTISKQHSFSRSDSGTHGGSVLDLGHSSLHADPRKITFLRNNSYQKGSSPSAVGAGGLLSQYPLPDSPNSSPSSYNYTGYSPSSLNLPPLFENAAAAMGIESRMLGGSNISPHASEQNLRVGNRMVGNGLPSPYMDPAYIQYLRAAEIVASQVAALNDPSLDRSFTGNPYTDLLQQAYIGGMMSPQKASYGVPSGSEHNHHGFYNNPGYGIGMSYPGSPLASPVIPNSPAALGSPMRNADYGMRYPSGMRNIGGGVLGPWHLDNMDNNFVSSLLEEFKSNKTKCFELSEIAGHVVEFSADQYGSRFIQQKLETATVEEKNMVFDEINPQALTLMTDVFGNYVVQKFFEHGMPAQRRELCSKLFDNVLSLSLQMYGCRVIQKAIEVVDVDQKIRMVKELDGHVMRCVRDQNGNHVIQKCIECVPEEHIQFIVTTFFGQVVTLSTHPYGCRVVQRVLEHCADPKTQSKVMEEILGCVSMLAQDQYGNYVVQHVLEHGKPDERSTIVQELAGNIVQMSQQKFASNVVEKCLTFGDPSERLLLVNEMLGTTDENEPLQAMMKDQFANYVVQKVLETCSDQQRELILSRIKVHLNALKKYTYGKHIVARVEKLVAAGERRIAAQSSYSTA